MIFMQYIVCVFDQAYTVATIILPTGITPVIGAGMSGHSIAAHYDLCRFHPHHTGVVNSVYNGGYHFVADQAL